MAVQSVGVNWGPSGAAAQSSSSGAKMPVDRHRSRRARSADEAIVSEDLAGQQNPLASQGPLD